MTTSLPLRIGLTGSIGMGKSTTAQMFRDEGVPVLDSDGIVHDLYRGAAVAPVGKAFPGVVVDGVIDRAALAARVLDRPEAMKELETIVHPLVWDARRAFDAACAARGESIVVYDIPLLFETGAQNMVDVIIVVSAPAEIQKARVLARPGMTEEKFTALLDRQVPDSEKRRQADFIVETDAGTEAARARVRDILMRLRGGAFKRNSD